MAWHHQRITFTQTLAAPAALLFVSCCGGGGGGGGGRAGPGGGGAGGTAANGMSFAPMRCVLGETLSVVIGAAGVGTAANTNGGSGGDTSITGSLGSLLVPGGYGGQAAPINSNGGKYQNTFLSGGGFGSESINTGANSAVSGFGGSVTSFLRSTSHAFMYRATSGAGGGALTYGGGSAYKQTSGDYGVVSGGSGGANGGGGGAGGCGEHGNGGVGGSNGAAGQNATGYGAGGGGGSGNAAGGDGSPGFLDIFWSDANETAPPTVAAIRAEMDSNSTRLASIDGKTTNLPSSPAGVGSAMTLTAAYDAAKTAASQSSVNAIPTTPLLAANYTAPDNASITAIKAKTDALPASPAAVGSAMTLTSDYDAAKTAASQVSVNAIPTTPLLAANYTAPDNASIATIKEKVDSIQVDAEGNVSADITRVLGADISGDGSIGNPWGPE